LAPEATGPREVAFARGLPLTASAEIALEDYARTLTGASSARAFEEGGVVKGVRLDGAGPVSEAQGRDIEDFALSLAPGGGDAGLGWS
jgi:hypothetical protein